MNNTILEFERTGMSGAMMRRCWFSANILSEQL